MFDHELHVRTEALCESLDGTTWEHIEALDDTEGAVLASRAYGQALVNIIVRAIPDDLIAKFLADPERARLHILRGVETFPWDDVIRQVLKDHQHRAEAG